LQVDQLSSAHLRRNFFAVVAMLSALHATHIQFPFSS
jgi:hypothetical protein